MTKITCGATHRSSQESVAQAESKVDMGQADPSSYAMVFHRLQTDAGKKQITAVRLKVEQNQLVGILV